MPPQAGLGAARRAPRRRLLAGAPRWSMWLVGGVCIAGCVAAVAAVVAAGGGGSAPPPARPDPAALSAYTAALRGPTSEGGEIVAAEMRPSLTELRTGQVDGATFAARARGWQLALQRVRARIDAVVPPASLGDAHALLDQALDAYAQAAGVFAAAGAASGAQRDSLLGEGVGAAAGADTTYDRAAALIQAQLRAAGLSPDADLPDPTPSPAS